jgi:VWFA-related protein
MKDSRSRYPVLAAIVLLLCQTLPGNQRSWAQQTPNQPQIQQQQEDQQVPAAGGPGASNGPIAIPKKAPATSSPPPPPKTVTNPPGLNHYNLQVNVPLVNVDVGVIAQKTHQFIPNLQEDNFRVFENGQPQTIIAFKQVKAPITAVLLLEFASNSWWFIQDMWNAAEAFTSQLQPNDYVAVVTYDMHTHILTDFTHNKDTIRNAISSLQMPMWNETNMFDALYQTLDRLTRVPGRKYIILVGSGQDTFSKVTLGQLLEKIKETPNVTIFTVSTGGYARVMSGPYMNPMRQMDFLQADNEMHSFAQMTGGMWFKPRFQAEFPEIFQEINASIRNQYQITYRPTDTKLDGTYRRIRVELVNNEGRPLRMEDQRHHPVKYEIIARDGYRARRQVE